jgi:hypothetical protein
VHHSLHAYQINALLYEFMLDFGLSSDFSRLLRHAFNREAVTVGGSEM